MRDSLWSMGGLTWKDLLKRVWNEIQEDEVFGRAAELAYYFLLALIPLLVFLTSVIGIIVGKGTGIRHSLFNYLASVMPGSAFQLIDATMYEVSTESTGAKLWLGVLGALWIASSGMGAITSALNVAYDVKESRPWWRQRLTAIFLTIALAVLIVSALLLVLAGGHIAALIAQSFGFGSVFVTAWKILQWPIVLLFILVAFALIYYFAPDLREHKLQWITPGAVIGVFLWLLVSFGFRLYLHFFDSYSKTYGSLGAVIVLMLWLYLTGAAVLIGGEVNAEIENEIAKTGNPEAKAKGEKAPGEKDRDDSSRGNVNPDSTERRAAGTT
jgi:membrane protein